MLLGGEKEGGGWVGLEGGREVGGIRLSPTNRHHKVMCVVRRREGGRWVGGIRRREGGGWD